MTRHEPSRLTALQERAMWALARLPRLTYATRLEDGTDPPWVVMSTVRALHRKGLVELFVRERMSVATQDREWQSPIPWDAILTRAGQEWVAARMVEIEELPRGPVPVTV